MSLILVTLSKSIHYITYKTNIMGWKNDRAEKEMREGTDSIMKNAQKNTRAKTDEGFSKFIASKKWYENHKSHVDKLVSNVDKSYPPSKEDESNCALWKGEHWKNFLELNEL